MKLMIFILGLLMNPSDDSMEILVDVQVPIGKCELFLIEDDELYEVEGVSVKGSLITLNLQQYKDYQLVVNNGVVITITINSYEIVDDRDIDVSADTNYEFKNGILVFEPYTYSKR